MIYQFAIGDTVKIKRSGLEVEVTELHPTDPARVICGWFDDGQMWWEVLFNVADIEIVKAKQDAIVNITGTFSTDEGFVSAANLIRTKEQSLTSALPKSTHLSNDVIETTIANYEPVATQIPEKPLIRHRKRKTVEAE